MATRALTRPKQPSEQCQPGSADLLRARPKARRKPRWQFLRAWWPARAAPMTCGRCKASMLDFRAVGTELLCIHCVADAQLARAQPALAGALAVLRVLWLEAEVERQEQRDRPFDDPRRSTALREVGEILLWWLTPCDLRSRDTRAVGESAVLEVLAAFDRVWALRCSKRRLGEIYIYSRNAHAQHLRAAALEFVDRQYLQYPPLSAPERASAGRKASPPLVASTSVR